MIIESLLDTDLYKFTMMQCVLHQFPGAIVRYRFKCRNHGVDLRPYLREINEEIDHLCSLKFPESELEYLAGLRYIRRDFVDFLSLFHLKRKYITVTASDDYECGIDISIEGPWLHTILFEIPVLAIVSEVYFRHHDPMDGFAEGRRRLEEKCRMVLEEPDNDGLFISDFGARRRFSRAWQEYVIRYMSDTLGSHFAGTSDVFFAKKFGLTPMGARIPSGLPGARPPTPRQPDVRFRYVGEGVPGRPRDRAVGCLRSEAVPERLRHVFLQAFRWREERFRRSVCLGRSDDQALRRE